MRSKASSEVLACIGLLIGATALSAQFRGFQAASPLPPPPVEAKAGETFTIPLTVRIRPGYHINSDKPLEDYLIPTNLSWDSAPFEVVKVKFPAPELVVYEFSEQPLSVFSKEIVITTTLRAPQKLPGPKEMLGRLRYQACNDKSCLAPTSVDIKAHIR